MMSVCTPEDLLRGGEPQNSRGGCAPNVSLHWHLISHPHYGESVRESLKKLVILGNLSFLGTSSSEPGVVDMWSILQMQAISQYYHGFYQCAISSLSFVFGFWNHHLRSQMHFFSLGYFSLTFFFDYLSNRCDHFFAWSKHQPMVSIARHQPAQLIPKYAS